MFKHNQKCPKMIEMVRNIVKMFEHSKLSLLKKKIDFQNEVPNIKEPTKLN